MKFMAVTAWPTWNLDWDQSTAEIAAETGGVEAICCKITAEDNP